MRQQMTLLKWTLSFREKRGSPSCHYLASFPLVTATSSDHKIVLKTETVEMLHQVSQERDFHSPVTFLHCVMQITNKKKVAAELKTRKSWVMQIEIFWQWHTSSLSYCSAMRNSEATQQKNVSSYCCLSNSVLWCILWSKVAIFFLVPLYRWGSLRKEEN